MSAAYMRFDDMTWPHPDDPDGVEWNLRYGEPSKSDRLIAASFIDAYRTLVRASAKRRNELISGIRRAALPEDGTDE